MVPTTYKNYILDIFRTTKLQLALRSYSPVKGMYVYNYSAEKERNIIRGTMMKWCGYVERKAYFQKLRVRVKTITHYTKGKKGMWPKAEC